jgi:hypothetical protein
MAIKDIRNYIPIIKYKLATAVSAGVIKGVTSTEDGHDHKFSVVWDERAKMFWGTTSRDGQGGHTHWIAASIYDVLGPVLNKDTGDGQRENTEELVVPTTNMPANMARMMKLWNAKEIILESHAAGYPDEHTHIIVLRYAGAAGENNPNPVDSRSKNGGGSSTGL